MKQYVYILTIYNDLYNSVENQLVFSSKEKALQYMRDAERGLREGGMLEESHIANNLAYIKYTDEDNMEYTASLDLVPKYVY